MASRYQEHYVLLSLCFKIQELSLTEEGCAGDNPEAADNQPSTSGNDAQAHAHVDGGNDGDDEDAGSLGDFIENDDSAAAAPGRDSRGHSPLDTAFVPKGVQPQDPIQPGATPAGELLACMHLAFDILTLQS